MKKITLIAVLATLYTHCAFAQESTLTVTNQELGIIGTALGMRPFNEVAPLITKLNEQVKQQDAAKAKAAEDAKKPADQPDAK